MQPYATSTTWPLTWPTPLHSAILDYYILHIRRNYKKPITILNSSSKGHYRTRSFICDKQSLVYLFIQPTCMVNRTTAVILNVLVSACRKLQCIVLCT